MTCDRCGKPIIYGALCDRCRGYVEGYMDGLNQGKKESYEKMLYRKSKKEERKGAEQ